MSLAVSKHDLIAAAAGVAVALVSWLGFLPRLPVLCFFMGLMTFTLTQKALRQWAAQKAAAAAKTTPSPADSPPPPA